VSVFFILTSHLELRTSSARRLLAIEAAAAKARD